MTEPLVKWRALGPSLCLITGERYPQCRAGCHSNVVLPEPYGPAPEPPGSLRGLPKPDQRRIRRAMMLGRPVPPDLADVAAEHGRSVHSRHTRAGLMWALFGVIWIAAAAFSPHDAWFKWLWAALSIVNAALHLSYGFHARRAARASEREL